MQEREANSVVPNQAVLNIHLSLIEDGQPEPAFVCGMVSQVNVVWSAQTETAFVCELCVFDWRLFRFVRGCLCFVLFRIVPAQSGKFGNRRSFSLTSRKFGTVKTFKARFWPCLE